MRMAESLYQIFRGICPGFVRDLSAIRLGILASPIMKAYATGVSDDHLETAFLSQLEGENANLELSHIELALMHHVLKDAVDRYL